MVQGLPRQVGMEPRWRDLPALALVQQRRFGLCAAVGEAADGARPRGFGALAHIATIWAILALLITLPMLVVGRLMGTVVAVDRHALLRITPTETAYQRRFAVLFVLVGCPAMAALIVFGSLPFAGLALAIGQVWPMYVGVGLVVGVPVLDVAGSSRRIALAAPRMAPVSLGRCPADHIAGALAAWPPGSRSGSRLVRDLIAACRGLTPLSVDFYARAGLVDYYSRLGLTMVDERSGLMRYSRL